MKYLKAVGLLLLLSSISALAQPGADAQTRADAAERARIRSQRQQAQATYEQGKRQCSSAFAVNDCMRDVKTRYRELMDDLRRQDISLNDAQRRRKAADQMQRIDKNQIEKQASGPGAGGKSASGSKDAEQKKLDKAQELRQTQSQAASRASNAEQKRRQQAQAAADRAKRAEQAAAKQKAFQDKQAKAAQHQADLQAQMANKTKPPAKPLPAPPP